MEKAIETLRQRFTTPSAVELQQYPVCGICWSDYEDDDQPVKLPCGHVFGEECALAWARGATPTGRHNGCPSCRAELLPPSLHSCMSVMRYWSSGLWPSLKVVLGGYSGMLYVGLIILLHSAERVPDSQLSIHIKFWSTACLLIIKTHKLVMHMGWRWAIITMLAICVTEHSARWLRGHL